MKRCSILTKLGKQILMSVYLFPEIYHSGLESRYFFWALACSLMPRLPPGLGVLSQHISLVLLSVRVRVSCRPRIHRFARVEYYPHLPLIRTIMSRAPFPEGPWNEIQSQRNFGYKHESSGYGGWWRRSTASNPFEIPWISFSWLRWCDRWG